MPTFECEECHCVDNSACGGTYWTKDIKDLWPPEYLGKLLCCVCASPVYSNGEKNERAGVWHNHFPRRTKKEWDKENK